MVNQFLLDWVNSGVTGAGSTNTVASPSNMVAWQMPQKGRHKGHMNTYHNSTYQKQVDMGST